MRIKRLLVWVSGVALLTIVVGLIAFRFLGGYPDTAATNISDPGQFNVPKVATTQEEAESETARGPEDKTLEVTIPAMARINSATVPSTHGEDEEALGAHAAIHLEGTGFPWQEEANVYLAGHRLGYPGTESWLGFWDLNNLQSGDEIYVEDADGGEYTYRVFDESFVVDPSDVSVTELVPGKNIITLQTCTLPSYSERLIVQAELVEEV